MSEKIDLNELVWDRDEEMDSYPGKSHSIITTDVGGGIEKIKAGIVKVGRSFGEARITVFMEDGGVIGNEWFTTWWVLDKLFGRSQWKLFLLKYELDHPETEN